MILSELLSGFEYTNYCRTDINVKGIAYDSRQVKKDFVFVALPGTKTDGNSFAADAVSAGAIAVVSAATPQGNGLPWITAIDPRKALAEISARFYRNPDRKLNVIGITGTNGKTTTSYFIESIFNRNGVPSGVIGTVNYRYGGKTWPAPNTTPQSSDVYRILSGMVRVKTMAAIIEVSSHALMLERVRGIEFDMAIFTNLTRDHLDFHQTMDEYFAAKSRLFASLQNNSKKTPKCAIINADDPWGKKLKTFVPKAKIVTYGLSPAADISAGHIALSGRGTDFVLSSPFGRSKIRLSHLGEHNVYNALAAAAAALYNGITFDNVIESLNAVPAVPGRLEQVASGHGFTVVVDFAHTDDALHNVITALRALKPARLITVFGCGGDRDRSKRPLMGEVATAGSDFVIVTSDNPRSEDPQKIALDIEVGIRRRNRNNYQVTIDREQAIAAAIAMAQKGDIILLAGKGHETYQIIGNQRIHFNDAETAGKYLHGKSLSS